MLCSPNVFIVFAMIALEPGMKRDRESVLSAMLHLEHQIITDYIYLENRFIHTGKCPDRWIVGMVQLFVLYDNVNKQSFLII